MPPNRRRRPQQSPPSPGFPQFARLPNAVQARIARSLHDDSGSMRSLRGTSRQTRNAVESSYAQLQLRGPTPRQVGTLAGVLAASREFMRRMGAWLDTMHEDDDLPSLERVQSWLQESVAASGVDGSVAQVSQHDDDVYDESTLVYGDPYRRFWGKRKYSVSIFGSGVRLSFKFWVASSGGYHKSYAVVVYPPRSRSSALEVDYVKRGGRYTAKMYSDVPFSNRGMLSYVSRKKSENRRTEPISDTIMTLMSTISIAPQVPARTPRDDALSMALEFVLLVYATMKRYDPAYGTRHPRRGNPPVLSKISDHWTLNEQGYYNATQPRSWLIRNFTHVLKSNALKPYYLHHPAFAAYKLDWKKQFDPLW